MKSPGAAITNTRYDPYEYYGIDKDASGDDEMSTSAADTGAGAADDGYDPYAYHGINKKKIIDAAKEKAKFDPA